MRLTFDLLEGWFFTVGPHSAWGSGVAWGALDFAPDGSQFGCYDSQAWVLSAADGWVVRSTDGVVVQKLEGGRDELNNWTVLYLRVAQLDRMENRVYLQPSERIGHPSCEGGPSSGMQLHIARRFNGEWIPADQNKSFVMDGWVSSGDGVKYNGLLNK